ADSSSFLSRLGVFANGQGNFGNADATSNQAGLDFNAAGLTVGADYRLLYPLILRLAFGYVRKNTALDFSAGDGQIRSYRGSLYGNYYILPRLYIDGIATFGGNHYDISRATPDGTATAKTDGNNLSISSSTGYNFNSGPLTFGPTGRFTYTRVHIDNYREQG